VTLHESAQLEQKEEMYLDQADEEASRVLRSETGARLDGKKSSDSKTKSLIKAISFHTQSLFYQHIVWLFLCWFLVVAIESERIHSTESYFDIFKVIFEIASAYGTVGLSLGYAGSVTSFSGILSPFSKFLIMTVMFLGRHRGLPNSLDPAISLYQVPKPKEKKKKGKKAKSHDIEGVLQPTSAEESNDVQSGSAATSATTTDDSSTESDDDERKTNNDTVVAKNESQMNLVAYDHSRLAVTDEIKFNAEELQPRSSPRDTDA